MTNISPRQVVIKPGDWRVPGERRGVLGALTMIAENEAYPADSDVIKVGCNSIREGLLLIRSEATRHYGKGNWRWG